MLPLPLSQIMQPTLLELGRLKARTDFTAYPNRAALDQDESPWRQSLDGTWRFQLISRPEDAPADWTTGDTSGAPWRDIAVPGVWTRQETGDYPHYANWLMPFDCPKPPAVPDQNPTGLYRTDFSLPKDWSGRGTTLHIGGFESLVMVWCNGQFIGLGKDSRLASAFDLSPALKDGTNQLAIMVVRWCDATWIEDQDHWNHGGLHRSVVLEARAPVHVCDLIVETDYDAETGTGSAKARLEVDGPSFGYRARLRLEDMDANVCHRSAEKTVDQFDADQSIGAQWRQSFAFHGNFVEFEIELPKAAPWSAETPARYRLIAELLDPKGEILEIYPVWIGFRRVETSDRRLRVNGTPIVLIGVNRHDHHPENGKTCSAEDIREDLVTMKRHNINAIRTAHYPNDPVLLDLADELGFYVIDEANVECHARWSEVANHPGYFDAILDRTRRMIARDRNHACIIGWSLGNEAGVGPVYVAAAALVREIDPSRFVHYEGAVSQRFSFPFGQSPDSTQKAPSALERSITDVLCPMYPPADHITDWAIWAEATKKDDRPLILCEFSHAMGNSNGSLSDYVDAFFEVPALGGGFVWDWRDQGLAETDDQGRFYWAYGGHYGDEPNDANFNINGLVGPDGVPHPGLNEYRWCARPVTARLDEDGAVIVENRRSFTDTSDLEFHWLLLRDGVHVEDGTMWPVLAPGEALKLDPFLSAATDATAEWHLTLSWSLKNGTDWAEAGHVVAWDQLTLQTPNRPKVPPLNLGPSQTPPFQSQTVRNGDLAVRFDTEGAIHSISLGDEVALVSPITACVWRAPTDNDGGKPGARPLFQNKTAEWVSYGLNDLQPNGLKSEAWAAPGGTIQAVERSWRGVNGHALTHKTLVQFSSDGLIFEETLIVPEVWEDLPRVGIRFEVAKAFDQFEWFGLGPDESYPDRKGAQTVEVWHSSIEEQYHPYVRPQEYGAHEETRWARLLTEAGAGLQFSFPAPLNFTARPHHDADLNQAETLAQLKTAGTTEVHIDAALRGLGTAACGPDALPQFHVGPGTYAFRWVLQAVKADA